MKDCGYLSQACKGVLPRVPNVQNGVRDWGITISGKIVFSGAKCDVFVLLQDGAVHVNECTIPVLNDIDWILGHHARGLCCKHKGISTET